MSASFLKSEAPGSPKLLLTSSVIMVNGKLHFPADVEQFMADHEGVVKTMMLSLPPTIESRSGRWSLVYLMELKEDYLKDKTEADKLSMYYK